VTELPEVRRADCGHGFLPIDTPPAARQQNGQHEQPVYLCEDCRARLGERKVETKDVRPAATVSAPDPYLAGRVAAGMSLTEEACPYPDRRVKDAKEWLRGFREAQEAVG
jgi:ribosome modulation factor